MVDFFSAFVTWKSVMVVMDTAPSYLLVFPENDFVSEQNGAKMGFVFWWKVCFWDGFVLVFLQKGRIGIYHGCDFFPLC